MIGLLLLLLAAQAGPLRVTFVNPGSAEDDFWRTADAYARDAAAQHEVQLDVVHADRNHLAMVRLLQEVVQRQPPPDVVIVVNEREMAPAMIASAERAGVRVFLAHNPLTETQAALHGAPGERFTHWIGSFATDDRGGGRLLTAALLDAARATRTCPRSSTGKLRILALHGDRTTPAATGRRQGLNDQLADVSDVEIAQEVWVDWDREDARYAAEVLLGRYPDACLIWAANDAIALGALEGARAAGRTPGRDVLVAGLNGSAEAVAALRRGELAATVAGHFVAIGVVIAELRRRADAGLLDLPTPPVQWPMYAIVDAGRATQYEAWRAQGWAGVDLEALRAGSPWGGANDLRIAVPLGSAGAGPAGMEGPLLLPGGGP